MNKECKTEKKGRIEINGMSAKWHRHCIEKMKWKMQWNILFRWCAIQIVFIGKMDETWINVGKSSIFFSLNIQNRFVDLLLLCVKFNFRTDQKWIQVDFNLVRLEYGLILILHTSLIIQNVYHLCHHANFIIRMFLHLPGLFSHSPSLFRPPPMRQQFRPSPANSPEYRLYDLNKRLSMRTEVRIAVIVSSDAITESL